MKNIVGVLTAGLVLASSAARAAVIETSLAGTGVNLFSTVANTTSITFDTGTFNNTAGATFSGTGAIVTQNLSNLDAQPFGDTTDFLGVPGPDPQLSSGTETINFNAAHKYFGLFWGSIDAYNLVSFYNNSALVASFGGAQIVAAANGDQTADATNRFVDFAFNGGDAFNEVVLFSSQRSFEVDNLAVDKVEEPGSLALLGAGLLGLGLVATGRRRRGFRGMTPA
jgi:hypothetical protein